MRKIDCKRNGEMCYLFSGDYGGVLISIPCMVTNESVVVGLFHVMQVKVESATKPTF